MKTCAALNPRWSLSKASRALLNSGLALSICGSTLASPSYHTKFDTTLPADYDQASAKAKQDHIWTNIRMTNYALTIGQFGYEGKPLEEALPSLELPGVWANLTKSSNLLHPTKLNVTLTRVSDELPKARGKVIHTFGTCATFKFIPTAHSPYTGIFQGGEGVLRFSYAGPPHIIGNVPGLGLKFFVDGKPSESTVVMKGLDTQGEYTSVFQETFSNVLSEPKSPIMQFIQFLFEKVQGEGRGFYLGVDHLAKVSREGKSIERAKAPYRLFFVPASKDLIPAKSKNDFRIDLSNHVKAGTRIYRVFAQDSMIFNDTQEIGEIRTTSDFIASEYGDRKLFFKHADETREDALRKSFVTAK